MALQSSGAISINQIKTELGSASYSLRTLSAAAGKSTPDAMSEFYGYSAGGAYKYGSPQLVFDFSQSGSYSNSGSSIADLSGNGNNGTFSTGTGNGSAATVTGYNSAGYLNLPGNSNQYSVRIPDSLKPSGTASFTFIVRMKPKGYSYNGNYPGILSHADSTLGLSWYLDGDNSRQSCWRDLNCGSNGNDNLSYSSAGGAGLNTWATYMFRGNSSSQQVHTYYNSTLYSGPGASTSCTITAQSGWGFFLGLRYNQWINADINYVAIYNSYLSTGDLSAIGAALQGRTPS
jgi:hypothetical protein